MARVRMRVVCLEGVENARCVLRMGETQRGGGPRLKRQKGGATVSSP